jgi:hypothetical protein
LLCRHQKDHQRIFDWTVPLAIICSCEHESIPTAFVVATFAPINCQTATDGTGFMDSAHQAMIAVLISIRDQADSILRKMERAAEQKSLSWKCAHCGHAKHFTCPVIALVPLVFVVGSLVSVFHE